RRRAGGADRGGRSGAARAGDHRRLRRRGNRRHGQRARRAGRVAARRRGQRLRHPCRARRRSRAHVRRDGGGTDRAPAWLVRDARMMRWALPALVLLGLPFALSEFWLFIAIEVLAFALYAVSFNVLLGYGGMLSFGHAAFFGVGGYAAAILVKKAGLPAGLAFVCLPFAAMAAAAAFAALIGFFSVR